MAELSSSGRAKIPKKDFAIQSSADDLKDWAASSSAAREDYSG